MRKQRKRSPSCEEPYHVWETCASQQPVFYPYAHWTWFSENEPFTFIVQVNWFWFIVHTTVSVSSFSIPVTASLPPLEWPLSHQSGSYELRIEVQPKPHHRAHYETEGSRGAVKAPTGGHPVVQVWTLIIFILFSLFVTRWFTSAKPQPVARQVEVCDSASYSSEGWGI